MKLKALLLTSLFLASSCAIADQTSCPSGGDLQFHKTSSENVGYWTGHTTDAIAIESNDMIIPHIMFKNGYSINFKSEIKGEDFINCNYYLQDYKSHVRTTLFNVSSSIHRGEES